MCALKSKYVAYGNLSCLEVITPLKSNYYKISTIDLKENAACMTSAYTGNQQLEMIIKHIKKPVNFSDAVRVPFTPKQVVTTAYYLIFSDRVFH